MHATGPRTPEGKAASAKNATVHGLTARTPRLDSEDADDYAAFVSGVTLALRPDGELERALAERAAVCLWRLRRAPHAEAALLNVPPYENPENALLARLTDFAPPPPPLPDTVTAYTTNGDELALLARYETHTERAAYRALAELRQVQAAKRRAPAPNGNASQPAGDAAPVS